MLKSDEKTGTVHKDTCTFMKVSCWILLGMRNVRHTNCREKENTLLVQKQYFKRLCHLWDNMENKGRAERPYMTLWYSSCLLHVDN